MIAEQIKEILNDHSSWLNFRGGKRADLRDANLRDANLLGANLSRANLSRADLLDADLLGADLLGANLLGANLLGANLIGSGIIDLGQRSDGYQFILHVTAKDQPMLIAGCRYFTIAKARAHWDKTRPRGQRLGDESHAMLDHAERMLAIAETKV
jgi:uncharacterized protein YjbI with pentapeptide repeats